MAFAAFKPLSNEEPFCTMEVLHNQGFSLIPLGGGSDGKSPLVKFAGRKRLPLDVVTKQMQSKNSEMYGVRLPGLVVIDCDTDNQATTDFVKSEFGHSNFQVKTPRGRHHYFKASKTKLKNKIKFPKIDIDVKTGEGSYVTGPGSIRPDRGVYSHDVCAHINIIKTLPPLLSDNPIDQSLSVSAKIPVGSRFKEVFFPKAIEYAPAIDSEQELFENLRSLVDLECEDPETVTDSEIWSVAKWAWDKRLKNELWGGEKSVAKIYDHEVDLLLSRPNGTDGLALLYKLHHFHAVHPGKRFALCTRSMAEANTIPGWSEWKFRKAKDALLQAGLISQVKKGGGYAGPNLYQLQRNSIQAA
jgi:hypothetical protein